MPTNETSSSRDDQVNEVIAAYLEAVDRGETPDRDKFLAEHVEYAAELRSFFDDQAQFHRAEKNERSEFELRTTATYVARQADKGTVISRRYTLLDRIGEGGMGTVWVAKQTEPVKRKVALKLIKTGMDSNAVVQRFEQERQALAMMDHPNIAKVLDGGITDEGRPFFVMELVNGLTLTKFCDEALLTPKARLELFVPICQAVQHAHQKGIIHRDLKPANILVTIIDGKPVPKIIDFGVAKALGGKLTDESISTQFGAVVGTLEYMSPEQAGFSGTDVDTRADIYSLGVILYELLIGLRPIDASRLKKAALVEMIRIIQQEEPSKPSTRLSSDASLASLAALRHTEPRKLMAMLRGELDWVVMKCLEKHRERRYETANGLAKDIQRFLDDEAVEARPPSAVYRFQKFWRRNKGLLLATSLVLLAVLGGLTSVLAVQRQANIKLSAKHQELTDEQAKVQARFELAEKAIKTFHTGVSEDLLLKNPQFNELRNRLLREAAGFYGELEKLLDGQTDVRSRKALSAAYFQLGDLTDKIGAKKDALAVHRKGLAVRRELATDAGADVETRLGVASSLLKIGQLLNENGDAAEALNDIEEQLNLAEQLERKHSTEAVRDISAQGHFTLGLILKANGKPEESLAAFERAAAIQQKLADDNPISNDYKFRLAQSYIEIGRVYGDILSKYSAAISACEQAAVILQRLVDANPEITDFQHQLARCHNNIGVYLGHAGNSAASIAAYGRSLAIRQQLVDANPSVTQFQSQLGLVLSNTGFTLREAGKTKEAMAACERALEILQKLVDANPDVINFKSNLANSLDGVGLLLSQSGKPKESIIFFQREETAWRQLAKSTTAASEPKRHLVDCLNNLADALRRSGRGDEARAACENALELQQHLLNENQQLLDKDSGGPLAETHLRLGQVRRDAGDIVGATKDWRRSLALHEGLTSPKGDQMFYRAGCHACLSGLSDLAASEISNEEGSAESDRAMSWLRQAVAASFVNPNIYRNESALDSLRDREDFKQLMQELEARIGRK